MQLEEFLDHGNLVITNYLLLSLTRQGLTSCSVSKSCSWHFQSFLMHYWDAEAGYNLQGWAFLAKSESCVLEVGSPSSWGANMATSEAKVCIP